IDEAIANGYEIVCIEGEKDADRLWSVGIPATCSAHGAAPPDQEPKWTNEHSKQLAGANIVVFGDHDAPGYAHQDATCKLSLGIAKRVRILKLADHWPEIKEGGDVSDYLDAGHTREQLNALIEQAPDYTAPPERNQFASSMARSRASSMRPRPRCSQSRTQLRSWCVPECWSNPSSIYCQHRMDA